jgi:hypothetical protein
MSDLSILWRKHRHIAPPGIPGVTTSACTSIGNASIPSWLRAISLTEFGKLWQDARDTISEANVITKAQHLIPASRQKWKDMNKLDVLDEALKRTEEAADAAEVEERDVAVAAVEMDGESDLAAHINRKMTDMSITVETSIEQTVEYRHPNSADIREYGTTTVAWDRLCDTLALDLKLDAIVTRGIRESENKMDAAASDGVDGVRVQQASSCSVRPHWTLPNQGCRATTRHSCRATSDRPSSAWPAGGGRRLESVLSMSDKALGAPFRSDLSLLTMLMVLAPGCLAAYTGPCVDLEPRLLRPQQVIARRLLRTPGQRLPRQLRSAGTPHAQHLVQRREHARYV